MQRQIEDLYQSAAKGDLPKVMDYLKAGVNPNAEAKRSPLYAVIKGAETDRKRSKTLERIEIVKALIKYKANVNWENWVPIIEEINEYQSPLVAAFKGPHGNWFKEILLKNGAIETQEYHRATDNLVVCRGFSKYDDSDGDTYDLIDAAHRADLPATEKFLQQGMISKDDKSEALKITIEGARWDENSYKTCHRFFIAKSLLEAKADPNYKEENNSLNETLLFKASSLLPHHTDWFQQLLIKNGADIDHRNIEGQLFSNVKVFKTGKPYDDNHPDHDAERLEREKSSILKL